MGQKATFDYANRLIHIHSGETEINVKTDLYSDGKEDWIAEPGLSKFYFPFRAVGGDPTVGSQFIEPYFFLQYGWQIIPQEADHNLTVTGNLFVDGGGNPYVPTSGEHTVLVNQLTTITTVETQSVSGESLLTSEEHTQLMALPTLIQIEGTSVLAKEQTIVGVSGEVVQRPLLTDIEGSTVLAKEATLLGISGEIGQRPTLTDIEGSTVLAKQTELLRALGLAQENSYLDQTVYQDYQGTPLLISGRIRTYTDAGSVGTGSNILATYLITAVWSNDELTSYKVVKQ